MKKTTKAIALVAIVIMCLVVLTGCAKKVEGKYTLVSANMGGISIEGDALADTGLEGMCMEFSKDNTVTLSGEDDDESEKATYEVNGDEIKITAEGESMTGKIDGNKITLEMDGVSMVFEKK